ncbi:MAG: hypothetical protein O4750_09815 [Trichodesmium sp. St18_bin3_1_1]|nr:hypothetical protein [Trichodesmium sp. St5_bin8]MDE5092035.1 hypothetical protein [Trichodesmium sp. St18_bin3_1_1]
MDKKNVNLLLRFGSVEISAPLLWEEYQIFHLQYPLVRFIGKALYQSGKT